MTEWIEQLQNSVNTLERLKEYINVAPEEAEAITTLKTKWGTTPYFASLMDRDDPRCPIRRQVLPSMQERVNKFGIPNYLIWKENRDTDGSPPRQYRPAVRRPYCLHGYGCVCQLLPPLFSQGTCGRSRPAASHGRGRRFKMD